MWHICHPAQENKACLICFSLHINHSVTIKRNSAITIRLVYFYLVNKLFNSIMVVCPFECLWLNILSYGSQLVTGMYSMKMCGIYGRECFKFSMDNGLNQNKNQTNNNEYWKTKVISILACLIDRDTKYVEQNNNIDAGQNCYRIIQRIQRRGKMLRYLQFLLRCSSHNHNNLACVFLLLFLVNRMNETVFQKRIKYDERSHVEGKKKHVKCVFYVQTQKEHKFLGCCI